MYPQIIVTLRYGIERERERERERVKIAKLKLNACAPMTLSIQITKFKLRQYQLNTVSPNLMLAKVIPCTVYDSKIWVSYILQSGK